MWIKPVHGTLRHGAQSLPGLTHAGNLQETVEAWTAKRDTENYHVTRAQPRQPPSYLDPSMPPFFYSSYEEDRYQG